MFPTAPGFFDTGAPLIIHPGRDERSPPHILDVLEEAGADLSRTVMSHIDRTVFADDALLQLAKRGCYLEYDMFGTEVSHYQVRGLAIAACVTALTKVYFNCFVQCIYVRIQYCFESWCAC